MRLPLEPEMFSLWTGVHYVGVLEIGVNNITCLSPVLSNFCCISIHIRKGDRSIGGSVSDLLRRATLVPTKENIPVNL
jgi:hypothetical protein